jgi:glycosyltransferase involved in cell wall biosynthesis/predicted SAM-dependent methyltransferase
MKAVELMGGSNPSYRPNIDVRPGPNVDIVANLEGGIPWQDNDCDLVYCRYGIEHLSRRKVKDFIREVYRITAPGGKAIFVTANLYEQAKVLVEKQGEWDDNDICMIFGDQDYPENTHKNGFSPAYAKKLFKEAGFSKVEVEPLPQCKTDMVITAHKDKPFNYAEEFDRRYFEDGKTGYLMYRDFPVHYRMLDIILSKNPKSVLELGGARGYITKRLIDRGIKAVCMDVSLHCWHTRATDSFILHDATKTPWQFKDKEFDLCYSASFMEHLREEDIPNVIKEIARVCNRAYMTITFEKTPIDIDVTHKTFRPHEWWMSQFNTYAPGFPVEIMTAEEAKRWEATPIQVPPPDGLVKLNIGSFQNMFHYGWVNIDIIDLSQFAAANGYVFKQLDVTKGLPYSNDSVDIILISHMLEHLSSDETLAFLKECNRVLKPDGVMRISAPDARLLCKKYLKGEIMEYKWVNVGVEQADDEAEALFHLLIAGHKTIYDYEAMEKLLLRLGFKDVKRMKFGKSQSDVIVKQTIDSYPTLSFYVEAKPSKEAKAPAPAFVTRAKDKLNIALISTPFLRTPPDVYGGLELIVAHLGEELAKLGHNVTVFAAKGSKVSGCRVIEFGEPLNTVQVDWLKAEQNAYNIYGEMLKEYDIVHGHNWFGLEYAAKAKYPQLKVIHTHHGGLMLDWWGRSKPPFKLNFVAISQWMKRVYEAQGFSSKFVYNGIDMSKYPFQENKGDRILFVGRIDKFKQPHVAIELAKKLNVGLDIVGGTQFVIDRSYVDMIRSQCDGEKIRFHPDVPHEKKVELMQNARALIFPSAMGEPFGLVAVEAMACGTPVLAVNDGAIDEIVKTGGIVCNVYQKTLTPKGPVYETIKNPVESLASAYKLIQHISPRDCRINAEEFSRENMAQGYLKLYNEVLQGNEW